MTENRITYQDKNGGETTLQKLFEIRALQLLLAGMYFLFGVVLTKSEKARHRKHAILMRKCISAANFEIETRKRNKFALDGFTNDFSPSWRARINTLTPRSFQRKLGSRCHAKQEIPDQVWDEREGKKLSPAHSRTHPSSPGAYARPLDEVFAARAPP